MGHPESSTPIKVSVCLRAPKHIQVKDAATLSLVLESQQLYVGQPVTSACIATYLYIHSNLKVVSEALLRPYPGGRPFLSRCRKRGSLSHVCTPYLLLFCVACCTWL